MLQARHDGTTLPASYPLVGSMRSTLLTWSVEPSLHVIAPDGSAPYPEEDEDGAAKEDEFEKFVGRFSKGPVPGEEQDKTSGKNNETDRQ